jgi:putative hydrolase of the HAD superfamily
VATVRIITFDLDDTLWDVRPALVRAEHDTRAWLAANVPDMAAQFDAHALHAVRNDLVAADPTIAHQLSRLRRDTYREAMIRTGYTPAEALRLADAAFAVFLSAATRSSRSPACPSCSPHSRSATCWAR